MENIVVKRYMRLIEPLAFEVKLELISKIFESLKSNIKEPEIDREALLDELYGCWEDVDDSLTEDILGVRTTSDKEINLD
jgi:hypothetical protein